MWLEKTHGPEPAGHSHAPGRDAAYSRSMSDLQCPATILVAGHGEANHQEHGDRSAGDGLLSDLGRAQVGELVVAIRSRQIAAVYTSRVGPAIESGQRVASALGMRSVAVDGLAELAVGDLDGDGHGVVSRFRDAIEAIADVHRGETVLVFTHGAVMALVVPRVSANMRNVLAAQRLPPSCVPVEIEVDADGWRLMSWPRAVTEGAIRSEQA